MKVSITIDLDERCRRAIARHFGNKRPATRAECASWMDTCVSTTLDDLLYEMDHEPGAEPPKDQV